MGVENKNFFIVFLSIFLSGYNSISGQTDSVIVEGNLIIKGKCDTIPIAGGDWTAVGVGWSNGGPLVANNAPSGSYVTTTIDPALEYNKTYKITFAVSGYSSGTLNLIYRGNYFNVSENGNYESLFYIFRR